LGQADDLFILAEAADTGDLWIIDQHVAHERILFDRMTAPDARKLRPQPLLVPPTLDVSPAQAQALEEHRELLDELGFSLELFGVGRYRLLAVPEHQLGLNYEQTFRDLADELSERSGGGATRLRREEVATAAAGRSCKRAVKAGQTLSPAEMERLLVELRTTRNPYTCPHGRPVFVLYTPRAIEELFGGDGCE
jgi:DNA mismatch repair protein MutL